MKKNLTSVINCYESLLKKRKIKYGGPAYNRLLELQKEKEYKHQNKGKA